jgi:hypothetical protein
MRMPSICSRFTICTRIGIDLGTGQSLTQHAAHRHAQDARCTVREGARVIDAARTRSQPR